MQTLTEPTDMKKLALAEKERSLYQMHAKTIEDEGKRVIASIKDAKSCEAAIAWRLEQRKYIESVEEGPLGEILALRKGMLAEITTEIKGYIDPCKEWMKKVKEKTDTWYAAEEARVRLEQMKASAKEEVKAVKKQEKTVQTLLDLGKHKQAKAVMRAPLVFTPPVVEMPKIKGAVWKKNYMVSIEDIGELLTYIAANPKYHNWIKQDLLIAKLEDEAVKLAGNMGEFPGIKCFQGKTSAVVDR